MDKKTIIIGIAGPSGSGKSLLASTIINELGTTEVAVLSEDRYYKDLGDMPLEKKASLNYDHPDAFDHSLLKTHLRDLRHGKPIHAPIYDHSNHARLIETVSYDQHAIVIIEGIMLFAEPELREELDIRIFVDTPLDICLIRRLQRDISERQRTVNCVIEQYQNTVRPMYLKFIEPSKRYADIIVPHGGKNRIATDMIKAKMIKLLSER